MENGECACVGVTRAAILQNLSNFSEEKSIMMQVPGGMALEILSKIDAAEREAVKKADREGVFIAANYDFMSEYMWKYKLPCWHLVLRRIYFAHLELVRFGSPEWRYTQQSFESCSCGSCGIPADIQSLGELVIKKYLMFEKTKLFVMDVENSLSDLAAKIYDDLDEEEEDVLLHGIDCPCLEEKHTTWAYYYGTFANRKLKKIWQNNGCQLHYPVHTVDIDNW